MPALFSRAIGGKQVPDNDFAMRMTVRMKDSVEYEVEAVYVVNAEDGHKYWTYRVYKNDMIVNRGSMPELATMPEAVDAGFEWVKEHHR